MDRFGYFDLNLNSYELDFLNDKLFNSNVPQVAHVVDKKNPHRCEALFYWWPGRESNL